MRQSLASSSPTAGGTALVRLCQIRFPFVDSKGIAAVQPSSPVPILTWYMENAKSSAARNPPGDEDEKEVLPLRPSPAVISAPPSPLPPSRSPEASICGPPLPLTTPMARSSQQDMTQARVGWSGRPVCFFLVVVRRAECFVDDRFPTDGKMCVGNFADPTAVCIYTGVVVEALRPRIHSVPMM